MIAEVHNDLPEDVSLEDRRKAIDAAYPFGPRKYYPYKMWLRERRAYLVKFGHKPRSQPPETPLERLMRRGKAHG